MVPVSKTNHILDSDVTKIKKEMESDSETKYILDIDVADVKEETDSDSETNYILDVDIPELYSVQNDSFNVPQASPTHLSPSEPERIGKLLRICEAKGCKNTNQNSNLSFFRLPEGDPKRLQKWATNIDFKGTTTRRRFLCSNHFEMRCFHNTMKRKLILGSVPTIQADTAQQQVKYPCLELYNDSPSLSTSFLNMARPINRGLNCPKYDRLISKKNAKSLVWNYFGLPANEEGNLVSVNLAICQVCKCSVSSKGGSTTNMIAHIKNYHPTKYDSFNANRSTSTLSASASFVVNVNASNSTDNSASAEISEIPSRKRQKSMLEFTPLESTSEKQCTTAVTKFIATAMQPYNIVECPPFIEMVKTLNPRYKLPRRKHFSKNAIPKLYNDTKKKIKKEFDSVKEKDVSITTDCWTSMDSVSFIAITAHFIDNSWLLKSICLSCVHFEMDHTAENISEILKETLTDWNFNINLLCSCTTDNGSNILKAVAAFDMQHIPCFGHTINIGINRALEISILREAITKMKKLQSSISHSWKMSRDLTKAQELMQMKALKLPSAYSTRWDSTLKLCKRFLQNLLPICKVMQDHPKEKHLMLDENEVAAIEDLVESTKLMEDLTKNLSGDKYATASSIIPLLKKIKKNLQSKEGDRQLVREIKKEILSALEETYFKCDSLMRILTFSTICDPRFRLNYIENKEEAKKTLLSCMVDTYEYNIISESTSKKTEKQGLEKLLDSDEEEAVDISLPAKKAENELVNYLCMPKIPLNEDPLNWWKQHEGSFPSLKVLAKKFLAVQGTNVPSERVFNAGGSVICKNRTSLLPKNAEMQVFLTQNKNFI